MNDLLLEAVGFLAGSIVTTAAMPRVIEILRDHSVARGESYARNAMLTIGNLAWVVYGVAGHALAIVVMCGLSATLNGAILVAAVRACPPIRARSRPRAFARCSTRGGRTRS